MVFASQRQSSVVNNSRDKTGLQQLLQDSACVIVSAICHPHNAEQMFSVQGANLVNRQREDEAHDYQ
jgi:hypothetical protein